MLCTDLVFGRGQSAARDDKVHIGIEQQVWRMESKPISAPRCLGLAAT